MGGSAKAFSMTTTRTGAGSFDPEPRALPIELSQHPDAVNRILDN